MRKDGKKKVSILLQQREQGHMIK